MAKPTQAAVVFNGKFLSAEPTGVHRVAEELVKGVFAVCKEHNAPAWLRPELWIPEDAISGAKSLGLPYRVLRPLRGIPWEQVTLPWAARHSLLVNLCNVGPMASTNAVTMFHDAQVRITPASYSWPFRLWYRIHQPIASARHQRILTVSNYSAKQLQLFGLGRVGRVGVVHNGVDHVQRTESDPGLLQRLGLTPHRYVVALANVQAHKNIGVLLRAFKAPALAGVKLVLFGGAARQSFESMGYPVGANVCFAGRVSDGELRGLYHQALAMAFPSLTEGFGLPPLEAMSEGCPAIVAPCGALPEVCGDAAVYADPVNPEAWTRAIDALANNSEERQHWAQLGLKQASRFTWRLAAERLILELEKVAVPQPPIS